MHRRSVVLTAAVMTGLLLGIVLAPFVRGGIASAQTEPPTATAQPQAKSEGLRALFLDKLAAALGIQRPALDSAITSAANATVNEAVQQGTLTQEQADAIKPRLQTGDVGPLFGGRGFGRGSHGGLRDVAGVKQAMLDAAASTLGITTAELNTQLRSGQTIAQLAQAHNTTEQAVVDAALAAAKSRLDAAVTAGTLTKAQADAVYARLQQEGLRFGGRHGGRGGLRGVPRSPQAAPTATPNA